MDSSKNRLNVCGPLVRRGRVAKKWSQATLAAKCQLDGWDASRDIIARLELRNREVRDHELACLARVLGVSLLDLIPRTLQRQR